MARACRMQLRLCVLKIRHNSSPEGILKLWLQLLCANNLETSKLQCRSEALLSIDLFCARALEAPVTKIGAVTELTGPKSALAAWLAFLSRATSVVI